MRADGSAERKSPPYRFKPYDTEAAKRVHKADITKQDLAEAIDKRREKADERKKEFKLWRILGACLLAVALLVLANMIF